MPHGQAYDFLVLIISVLCDVDFIHYYIVDRSLCEKKISTTQILLKGYLEKPMPKAHIATLIG